MVRMAEISSLEDLGGKLLLRKVFNEIKSIAEIGDDDIIKLEQHAVPKVIAGMYEFTKSVLESKVGEIRITNVNDYYSRIDISPASGKHYWSVPSYIFVALRLSSHYRYGTLLGLFRDAVRELFMENEDYRIERIVYMKPRSDSDARLFLAEIYNNLFNIILDLYYLYGYKNAHDAERKLLAGNYNSMCEYVDRLFECHAKLLVIRVDLNFKKIHSKDISLSDAAAYIDKFLSNRRHNKIFDGLEGYIGKLEYGFERGAHWHMIFFFNAQQRHPSACTVIGQKIGEYWVDVITEKKGDFYNVIYKQGGYFSQDQLGVGCMSYTDQTLIKNLKENVLTYFAKEDQVASVPGDGSLRRFRRGTLPTPVLRRPRETVIEQSSI